MTSQKDKDAALRAQPDGYVDPHRKRLRAQHRKPGRSTVPKTRPSGPPSDPTSIMTTPQDKYPRHMKLGIMMIAIQDGVPHAAEQFKVPERTVYGWFREQGGLNAVREYAQAAAENSATKLIQEACEELRTRLKGAGDEDLFDAFKKILDTMGGVGGMGDKSAKGRGVDSGQLPGSAQGTPINLIFNSTPPLPPGSEGQGNASPGSVDPGVDKAGATPPEDIVEGEVVGDVFDDA